jgi:hypothetical protein
MIFGKQAGQIGVDFSEVKLPDGKIPAIFAEDPGQATAISDDLDFKVNVREI